MRAAVLALAALGLGLTPALGAAQTQPPPSAGLALKAGAQAIGKALKPQDPLAESPAPAPVAAPAPQAPPGQVGAPPAAAPTAQAVPPMAPGGLLVPGSEFRYDPTGRRDPFKSLLQLEKKQRDVSQLPPIQQFDLDTVKIIGIVDDPGRGAQAIIKAPSGQTFVLRVGTIVGKNDGEVVEITLKGIRVVEKFLDFMNRETRKETFLKSHSTAAK